VFLKKDAPGTVSIVNLKEKNTLTPAWWWARVSSSGRGRARSSSIWAKRMVLMRSERFARFALGTPALLEIAVRAGLSLGGCPIGNGPHGDEVDKMAKTIDGLLSAPLRAELKVVAKKFVDARGDRLDLPSWIVASDSRRRARPSLCVAIWARRRGCWPASPRARARCRRASASMTCWPSR